MVVGIEVWIDLSRFVRVFVIWKVSDKVDLFIRFLFEESLLVKRFGWILMHNNFDLPRVINFLIAMNQTVIMRLVLFDLGISGKV